MHYKDLKSENFPLIDDEQNFKAKEISIDQEKKTKVYIFKTPQNNNVCLIKSETKYEELPQIKGFELSLNEYGRPGEEKDIYVKMECLNSSYNDIFTKIIIDILKDFDESERNVLQAIKNTLHKWKTFLADQNKRILSEDEITGLIGELLFLKEIINEIGNKAVNYWIADKGGNDFVIDKTFAEIKATTKEKHEHIINGIDQLLEIQGKQKYLLSLIFSRSASTEAINLPMLVQYFYDKLQGDFEISDIFLERLVERGYDFTKPDNYNSYSYHLIRGAYFKIEEGIPRLTTKELKNPLDSRISKVRYTLNLEGLNSYEFNSVNTANIFFDGP